MMSLRRFKSSTGPRGTPRQTTRRLQQARLFNALCVLLACVCAPAHGQLTPKRLSQWLIEQPDTANSYAPGLSWRVPDEIPRQNALRLELLQQLANPAAMPTVDEAARQRLRLWLSALPVTGRVPLASTDPRWLEVNPRRDPLLKPGHSIITASRPDTVTVIGEDGRRCSVVHVAGYEASAYIEACHGPRAARTDWVWLAQPDGQVRRYGMARWNSEVQDEPAPGAWLWAPSRDSGWPQHASEQLILFLSTQGPADDRQPGDTVAALPLSTGLLPPSGPAIRSRNATLTTNDWGGVGLLQTPSARMHDSGHFAFDMSHVQPYTRGNVFLQPFDWMEAGFRYTDISNRLYGADIAGTQSYKDKGLDIKIRAWRETAYLPELAVGLHDLTGTGLFSGEYLVGSKRTGPLDWSLGLGWGYAGARGSVNNPFTLLSKGFDTRTTDVGQGGKFSPSAYFHGRSAFFGGVQYQTPWPSLILKLEYDGNDYQHEPQDNNQTQKSPWNIGLVYRPNRTVDLKLGFERGNTLMLGFTIQTQLDQLSMPKPADPARVAVATSRPQNAPDWSLTGRDLAQQTNWAISRIDQQDRDLRVTVDDADAGYWRERIDRAAAVLHRDAPANVERFALAYRQRGVPLAEHVIHRETWVADNTAPLPPREQRDAVIARPPVANTTGAAVFASARPRFESGLGVNYAQGFGGPDGFVLFQLSAVEQAKYRIRDDTWLQGSLQLRLLDNYDKYKFTGASEMPRVRTYIREYLTTAQVTLPNLQATHVGGFGENQYFSLYGGYLESMFAGGGGEWLYRPLSSRVAFGVDANLVRQRNFRQDFGFGDAGDQSHYSVATGHATLYWDTGWENVVANLSAGRYLAKDMGATVSLSRAFQNGVRIGAYFTKTNVSAETYGEGSFDKGIFVSMPFDVFLTRSSGSNANFLWRPLVRDGGNKLNRAVTLYDLTNVRDERTLQNRPAPASNAQTQPANAFERWSTTRSESEPYTRVEAKASTTQWAAEARYEQRLQEELHTQGFRNLRIALDTAGRLNVTLTHDHLPPLSRAVGRAARTALRLAPLEAREIRIDFGTRSAPRVRYEFFDLKRLARYFDGQLDQAGLADYVAVTYLDPAAREENPLAGLGDLDAKPINASLASVVLPELSSVDRVANDFVGAARMAAKADWLTAGAVFAGAVIASSTLDHRADEFALQHADKRWLKGLNTTGNALPWVALGGAALVTLDDSDPVRARTGYTALEAGGTALIAVTGMKYAVGRARPQAGLGSHQFQPFSGGANNDSFPSGHAITAWSVLTPFALEYDAPWLYGVASLTNAARVGSRQHWLSDTVGGSLLGYGIGRLFWESNRDTRGSIPRITLSPSNIEMKWTWK